MYIIAGLGNPGKKYEQTRHNMGFLAVDFLAEKYDIKVNKIRFRALTGEGRISWTESSAAETPDLHEPERRIGQTGLRVL